MEINPPVNPQLIENFESKYNSKLPGEYKTLLELTNGFSLMGDGVLGLDDKPNVPSLENIYQIEHFETNNNQPLHLIPFCNDGRGNYYCMDTSRSGQKHETCPVVFWQWDLDYSEQEPETTNESLLEWIKEVVIEWTLEDYDYEVNER